MKFVSYEKLNKKQKKEHDALNRRSWGDVNPVSRVIKSKKVYSRKTKHKSLLEENQN